LINQIHRQLWTNQLSGTIPTEFGNMTSLTNLYS